MFDHDADIKTDDTRIELLRNRSEVTRTVDLSETTFNWSPTRFEKTVTVNATESREQQLVRLQDEFERYSGAKLVFSKNELATEGKWDYFDRLPELSSERKIQAAEIAVREIKMYPSDYLKTLELKTLGIFDACISFYNDGYHEYDPRYGGYRYFGVFNGKDGLAAAYYSDSQLPLTIHHEIFHATDSTKDGVSNIDRFFDEDNKRFSDAINGRKTYPALEISPQDMLALKAVSKGRVLKGAVSAYTAKNANEDQAETARYLMDFLPDALVQIVEQPQLPGSQRIMHVIKEYENSGTNAPTLSRLVDVALGRTTRQPEAFQKALLDADNPALLAARDIYKKRYELITEDGKFTVRGSEAHPNGSESHSSI